MRIAFVGKGGSGKTTSAAMFSRYLAAQDLRVLAIDADINQHLAQALGHDSAPPPPLGADALWLKAHLRGTNPRIADGSSMIKTTPPGAGSVLLDLGPGDEVLRRFAVESDGVRHLAARGVRRGRYRGVLLPFKDRRGRAVPEPPDQRRG
jgi:CO dehydrogenase maturation factor